MNNFELGIAYKKQLTEAAGELFFAKLCVLFFQEIVTKVCLCLFLCISGDKKITIHDKKSGRVSAPIPVCGATPAQ